MSGELNGRGNVCGGSENQFDGTWIDLPQLPVG